MKRNKLFTILMTAFAPLAVLATISHKNIIGNYAEQITYGLVLDHSNGVSGSNVSIEKNIKTSSGQYDVNFEYSNVTSSNDGHCILGKNSYLGNKDHILSIDSIKVVYSSEGKVSFKSSYDYNSWSNNNEIESGVTYHLDSHPYFVRFYSLESVSDITSITYTYTCQVNENIPSGSNQKYKLLTNSNQLTVGNKYVIAASDADYAISNNQKDNNRGAAEITRNKDNTISLDDDVCEFTLANGSKSGTYAFYDSVNEGYIFAASSSKNYLRTQSNIDANASFTISLGGSYVVDMTANGSNSRNQLYYNSNNGSPMFSCYGSFNTTLHSHLQLYYLDEGTPSVPKDEIGITATDSHEGYKVGDIFDNVNGLLVTVKYTDGTSKVLDSSNYTYNLENSNGETISSSTAFADEGNYTCVVNYKTFLPVRISFTVSEVPVTLTKIEAILIEDEFLTTDTLLLEDNLLFDLTYSDGNVVDSLEYDDLSTYGLALSLYNPNDVSKSLNSVLSDAGEWTLVIYLIEDNSVRTEINFTVTKASSDLSGWEIVTSSSNLIAGDEYVIASFEHGVSMSELDGKVFSYVNTDFTDIDFVESFPEDTLILTLGGSSSGWTFTTSNGVICSTAVKCMAYDSGTSTWLIDFDGNNAFISSTSSSYGTIYYNSSSPRFTTYTSTSMTPVQLYHKVNSTPIYPTAISIPSTLSLGEGETQKLTPTLTPSNANTYEVTWSSNKESVAQVDSSGNVIAVSAGSAVITATTKNEHGTNISSTCSVTVTKSASPEAKEITTNVSDFNENSYYDTDITPSTGNPKLLVIPVWFTDSSSFISTSNKETVRSDIEKAYFGSNEETGWRSVKTFYEEESHNKVSLTGVVTDWYSCGKSYKTLGADEGTATNSLVKAATKWYFDNNPSASRKSFDTDGNGYLDGVMLIYGAPDYDALNNDDYSNLWAYCFWLQDGNANKTNPNPNAYFWASYDFMYGYSKKVGSYYSGDTGHCNVDAHTYIHEMGHMFGLEDYYDYSGYYSPAGGFSMQDYNVGGHDPYSCLQLGWAKAIIPTKTSTISLKDFQSSGEVILLTPSWNEYDSIYDEYLLLELFTPTGLNKLDCDYQYSACPTGPKTVGIRLWHVDARLVPVDDGYIYEEDITSNPNADGEGMLRVMSNTYWSSDEDIQGYCSIFGEDYANYNELQLIRKNTNTTYKPTSYLKSTDLFVANDTFSMSTYAKQFVNNGKLNSGLNLGWSFTVALIANNVASITVTKI